MLREIPELLYQAYLILYKILGGVRNVRQNDRLDAILRVYETITLIL